MAANRRRPPQDPSGAGLVLLLGKGPEWQPELQVLLVTEGYTTRRVAQLEAVLSMLAQGPVQALFLAAGPLAATDVLLLQQIREASPRTAVVAVGTTPTDPDLKRALESGATAFLSWPATNDGVRHAIDRGPLLASAAPGP